MKPHKHDGATFWARVKKTPTCWLWTGPRNAQGQGRAFLDGVAESVQRVAYRLSFEDDPEGHYVVRTCGELLCVNPAHLRLAGLTPAIRDEIRALYAAGGITQHELGKRFGVTRFRINAIVNEKRGAA